MGRTRYERYQRWSERNVQRTLPTFLAVVLLSLQVALHGAVKPGAAWLNLAVVLIAWVPLDYVAEEQRRLQDVEDRQAEMGRRIHAVIKRVTVNHLSAFVLGGSAGNAPGFLPAEPGNWWARQGAALMAALSIFLPAAALIAYAHAVYGWMLTTLLICVFALIAFGIWRIQSEEERLRRFGTPPAE